MTKREEIEALRQEVAELRAQLVQLASRTTTHHHYAAPQPSVQTPWQVVSPTIMPSPNICSATP